MLSLSDRLIALRFSPNDALANWPRAKRPTLKPFTAALPWHGTQRGEKPMMSLSEAAIAAGIAKSTIWRAIKAGRMSASKGATGSYQVDAAELFRVFPATPKSGAMRQDAPEAERGALSAALEAQISTYKDISGLLREQLDDVRKDRDAWRTQAEANQRLLVDGRRRRGFFGWG